jgi:hypothetical protein
MRHHEVAIEEAVRRYGTRAVVAVVVVGSVARGDERDDSDVDLCLIVDDAEFERQAEAGRVSFVELHELYPEGVFDVKHVSESQLRLATVAGDEPMRASFEGARVAWAADGAVVARIAELVAEVAMLPDEVWAASARAFDAQARLHGEYFLPQAVKLGDLLLLHHAAVHLAFAVGRAVLAREHVLFAGPKYLRRRILATDQGAIVPLLDAVVDHPSAESASDLLHALERLTPPPASHAEALSLFVRDNELAWATGVTPPEYR